MELIANPSFRYGDVDGEMLVCDPASGLVLRLSGDEATVVRTLLEGKTSVEHHAAVDRLAEAGVVIEMAPTESLSGVSRRRMIQLSAVTAAAAGLVVALPSAAAAASLGPGGYVPPDSIPPAPGTGTVGLNGVSIDGSRIAQIFWLQGNTTGFTYLWVIYNSAGQIVTQGTANSNTFVSPVTPVPSGGAVRLFLGDTVFQFVFP